MITIPVWLFVLLIILAAPFVLSVVIMLIILLIVFIVDIVDSVSLRKKE